MKTRYRKLARGFSLVEVAVATIIIGLGVAALMVSVGAGTRTNNEGMKLTEAVFLAQEMREWTLKLPFVDPNLPNSPPGPEGSENPQVSVDDLDDLMNVTYSPPRNGQGSPITDMAGWSQHITITWQDENSLALTVSNGSSNFVYVEVRIAYQGQEVLTTGWLVARR